MSVFFECDGKTVWNPGADVAVMFVHQVRGLELMLRVSSGLTGIESDEVQIDVGALAAFIASLEARLSVWRAPAALAMCDAPTTMLCCLYALCEADRSRWPPLVAQRVKAGCSLM
jgi:hypothetical protein